MNWSEKSCTALRSFDPVQITRILFNLVNFRGTTDNYLVQLSRFMKEAGVPLYGVTLFQDEPEGVSCLSCLNTDLSRITGDSKAETDITSSHLSADDCSDHFIHTIRLLRQNKIITTLKNKKTDTLISWSDDLLQDYFSHIHGSLHNLLDDNNNSLTESFNLFILPLISNGILRGTVEIALRKAGDKLPLAEIKNFHGLTEIIAQGAETFLAASIAKDNGGKSGAAFELMPDPSFIVNREGIILEANSAFRKLVKRPEDSLKGICCKKACSGIIQGETWTECLIEETFDSEILHIREVTFTGETSPRFFRITGTPIKSESGQTTAVLRTMTEITERIREDREIKEINNRLEEELTRKINILKEKERHLHSLVETVHHIESGVEWSERLYRIIAGFTALDSKGIALVIRNNNTMEVARVFPGKINEELAPLLNCNPESISYNMSEHRENPFTVSAEMINPIFFIGEEGVRDFFSTSIPNITKEALSKCEKLFEGLSIIIFPLETKDGAEGAIAVSASLEILENNFEYFQLLSNTAAVEINRKNNAAVLEKSEKRYRSLIESSRDMIAFCNRDGEILFSNKTFYDKTGLSPDEAVGTSLYNLIPYGDKQKVENLITSVLDNSRLHEPKEIILKGNKNKNIWTEMTITRAADNGNNLHIAFRDISYRKNLETQLSDITTIQDQIIQTDMIGIVTTDLRGMISRWNSGAHEILGYSEIEALGKNISDFIVPAYRPVLHQHTLKTDTPEQHHAREIALRKNDGSTITAMYAEEVMKDSSGRPILIVSFFFDVTEKLSLEARSKELMRQLSQAQQVTILSLAKLTEYRDLETGSHLERIMKYTEILAQELSGVSGYANYISDEYILDLVSSCPLHDIGKVGIPDNILHKPGKLTREEFEIMKNHTIIGGDTIREAEEKLQSRSYLNLGREVAYSHHEKWDGSGYPQGLMKEEIPLSARIVAVADVYDALISKRPYKEAYDHGTAAEIIKKNGGSHFDPAITDAFTRCESLFEEYSEVAFQEVSREGFFSQEIDIDNNDLN